MRRAVGIIIGVLTACDVPEPTKTIMGEFERLEACDFVQTDEEGERFLSIEDYLVVNHRVAPTLYDHISNFDNACLQTERQADGCSGTLYAGCGLVQYEPFGDESYYRMYSYDAETGQLVGALSGSDTATFCPDGSPTVDAAGDAELVLSNTGCEQILQTYCCGWRDRPAD